MDKSTHTREYAEMLAVLREMRENVGVTQVELAERLGVTQSYLSKIERGESRLDLIQLRTICDNLGTPLGTFVRRFEKRLGSDSEHRRSRR